MNLREMAKDYRASARLLRGRLHELRIMEKQADDRESRWHVRRRISELTKMLTEANELAELTEHYYERGYYRNERYRL